MPPRPRLDIAHQQPEHRILCHFFHMEILKEKAAPADLEDANILVMLRRSKCQRLTERRDAAKSSAVGNEGAVP
jgi:hypothetical protein